MSSIRPESTHKGFTWLRFTAASATSLLLALGLASCTQVASTSNPSLIRVIDASYIAPSLDVTASGTQIASNLAQGSISQYGAVKPSNSASIVVSNAAGGATLLSTKATLLDRQQSSVFISDNGAAKDEFTVTVLEDQSLPAADGHSSFRFLNQAPRTGAIDIYMVPGGGTLTGAVPLVADLPAGSATGYLTFPSKTLSMVVTPAGSTKAKYTSKALALAGGEVRTALIVDTELTGNPPVDVFLASDVN